MWGLYRTIPDTFNLSPYQIKFLIACTWGFNMVEKIKIFCTSTLYQILLGFLLGFSFLIAAFGVDSSLHHLPFSFATLISVEKTQPLYWIFDCIPFILAVQAFFNNRMMAKSRLLQSKLETIIEERTVELSQRNSDLQNEIEEREKVEQIVGLAKKTWEATVDTVKDLIIITDSKGNVVRVNQAVIDSLNTHYLDILGKFFPDVFGFDNEVLWSDQPAKIPDFAVPNLTGFYEISIYPIHLVDVVDGRVYTLRDITETKKHEAEIKKQKEFFEALMMNSPVAIVILDLKQKIVSCNPAFSELFGYTDEEIIGRNLDELISPTSNGTKKYESSQQINQAFKFHGFSQRLRKDKTLIDVEFFEVPVIIGTEKEGSLSIFHDISELINSRQEAESADRAKTEFLAMISHEIRSPISGLIGMIDLASSTEIRTDQQEYLQGALQSADHVLNLLNDILDFIKTESGHLEIEMIDFDVRATLENVVHKLYFEAEKKKIEMACLVDHEIPSSLKGDPTRLRQILANLIGNAIKFTEKGEVFIRVTCESENETRVKLRFTIKDSGIGIPKDRLSAIFEKFVQADSSTNRKYGGSGLGLTISKQLVNLMGGEINVESEVGKGSTFWLTIPFEKSKNNELMIVKEEIQLENYYVLIIDDNESNRDTLSKMLNNIHCRIDVASFADEAISLLHSRAAEGAPVQCMFVDLNTHGLDIERMLNTIQSDALINNTAIIVLTSAGQRGDPDRFSKMGCKGYLLKPVRQSELLELLKLVSNHKEKEIQLAQTQMITRHTLSEKKRSDTRILVAEDNLINQKLILVLLQKAGYSVDIVANGTMAVEAVRKHRYGLVFMDVQMPELDGLEATQQIRKLESAPDTHTTIIAMTAYSYPKDREMCLRAGMDGFISKPITPNEILTTIDEWINRQPLQPQPAQNLLSNDSNIEDIDPIDIKKALTHFGNDIEFFSDMLLDYKNQLTIDNQTLIKAVESHNAKRLAKISHEIKGLALNFCAFRLAAYADELEKLGKESDFTNANILLDKFEGEIFRIRHFTINKYY
jgi:two-component system, sensor histidine kinase and response regulator